MFMQRRDFTLIELLSVIGIIAIVAAIILGGMNYASRRADEAKTIAAMESLIMALEEFKDDRGYYPISAANEVELSAGVVWDNFLAGNSKTNRPYMEGVKPGDEIIDAYGNPFFYQCPGEKNPQKFDLWSRGSDGKHGDDDDLANRGEGDDICNWKRR